MKAALLAFALFCGTSATAAAPPSTLEEILAQALANNPDLAATKQLAEAEHAKVRSSYSLPDPMIGYENNRMFDPAMRSWSITQEIQFPSKYFAMGAAQRQRAAGADSDASAKRLEIRKRVISAFYRIHSLQQIQALLEAELSTAREVARAAEARRATGAVPQQDEMKAHVEETRANAELVMSREELARAQADLGALLGSTDLSFELVHAELPEDLRVPRILKPLNELNRIPLESLAPESPSLRRARSGVERTEAEKQLSMMNYLPDFRFMFQKPFDNDQTVFRVEASIPLWFFMRQTSQVASASARVLGAEKTYAQSRSKLAGQIRSLLVQAEARSTLLKIDETSLIPQATAALNSSLGAYRAGRVGLLELLDSQRALYNIRIGYYRTLMDYVDTITDLESSLAQSISNLPFSPEEKS